MDDEHSTDPRGIPGKWVVFAVFAISFAIVGIAVLAVRPTPGSKPADVNNRPFGPATAGEQDGTPLIYRNSGGGGDAR